MNGHHQPRQSTTRAEIQHLRTRCDGLEHLDESDSVFDVSSDVAGTEEPQLSASFEHRG